MTEFWESSFREKQTMWGFEPADSAIDALELFQKNALRKILIPGFGYGRNAKVFMSHGFDVTGIEISGTAIQIAKNHFGDEIKVYHGPVNDMPYGKEIYDGIFCYALIHLLAEKDRAKLIHDCYHQLRPGGYMIFVAISTKDNSYGKGEFVSMNRFLTKHGVELFFYDSESITNEFGTYGLLEAKEILEPAKEVENRASQQFWQIVCKKEKIQA